MSFLPDCMTQVEIVPGYPVLEIQHPAATARIALHGAHVMDWIPAGEKPVIYMSPEAVIELGKPIRGGIPICWPWFGPHPTDADKPAHGFVRTQMWQLEEVVSGSDRLDVMLSLRSSDATLAIWPHEFSLQLRVSIGAQLESTLVVRNPGSAAWTVTGALHTYLCVADVSQATLRGLHGTQFIEGRLTPEKRLQSGPVKIDQEVDRIYLSDAAVEVEDVAGKRTLVIEKAGSRSTVIWNPWIEKSKRLADLPDNDYPRFLCVETTNAGEDSVILQPGGEHRLTTRVRVRH
jgi:glucose-6-phosphate 1-epimerase